MLEDLPVTKSEFSSSLANPVILFPSPRAPISCQPLSGVSELQEAKYTSLVLLPPQIVGKPFKTE